MSAPTFIEHLAILGVRPSEAQEAICRIAFDGESVESLGSLRSVAHQMFGRIGLVDPVARSVFVLVAGARSGKSYFGGLRLLHLGLTVDLSSLAPGEMAYGAFVGPDLRLARQDLAFVRGEVERGHVLRAYGASVFSSNADEIVLRRADGRLVSFHAFPATRGGSALRGKWFFGAVFDEFAFFRDEESVVNDRDVFDAVSARLLPGGQLVVASTPWIKAGELWRLFSENHGKPSAALVAHAPTSLLRKGDEAVEIGVERERRRDPRNASREFDAQWADAASSIFEGRDVDACVDEGVDNRRPDPEAVYWIAFDVGLRRNWSWAIVFHVELRRRENGPPTRVLVVDASRHLRPSLFGGRVSIDQVEGMIADLAKRYRVKKALGDIHYADAIGPRLEARGVKFEEVSMTVAEQAKRVSALASKVSSRCLRLVDDSLLVDQIKNAKELRRAGGMSAFEVAEKKDGSHGDGFDALLIAAGAAADADESKRIPVSYSRSDYRSEVCARFEPGIGLSMRVDWLERRGDEWVRCLPPEGTPAREAIADRLAAEAGAFLPERQGELAPGASTTIHGLDVKMKFKV